MTLMPTGVLLVEDDEGDALLVRECLREAGVAEEDVVWRRTVSDGIDALADAPACVLLDLGLPDAVGLDAVHNLVAQDDSAPVIVLTGRHGRTGIDAVAAGAQDYLVKDDLTPELLDRSIRYAVERHQAQATELQLAEERMLAQENSRLERGLLPRPLLHSDFVTCSSHYQPGRARAVLGGDFFDVIETPDGRVRAIIGDVMGHGPDEAALGVHLRVAWRSLVLAGVTGDQILATLSRLLSAEGGGLFVTVCEVVIDRDLALSVRVAGHPPPMVCSGGSVHYLDLPVGPPLGVLDDDPEIADWPVTSTSLPAGGSLILYTDGLLDAYRRPEREDSLGLDELLAATEAALATGPSVPSLVPQIVSQTADHATDDTAVVALTVADSR